jgi:hypothetical protein
VRAGGALTERAALEALLAKTAEVAPHLHWALRGGRLA